MLIKPLTREALFTNRLIYKQEKINRMFSSLKFVYLLHKYQKSYFSQDRKDTERKVK